MSEESIKKTVRETIRENLRPRNVVKHVVGHSTKFIVTTAVVKIIQPEKTADKVRTSVGGYVLGSMVAEHTESFALRKFDTLRADAEELKDAINDATSEPENPENPDTPTE